MQYSCCLLTITLIDNEFKRYNAAQCQSEMSASNDAVKNERITMTINYNNNNLI